MRIVYILHYILHIIQLETKSFYAILIHLHSLINLQDFLQRLKILYLNITDFFKKNDSMYMLMNPQINMSENYKTEKW